MGHNSVNAGAFIAPWHRNLLVITAIFTVLLISMGGILCVTQSIRDCPDWPGCFGKVYPPLETGPVLEYTHRVLAAVSGLLIVGSAITGLVRTPHLRWVTIPPLVSVVLLVVVSYLGAVVVLRGLSPGWAALDVGSALLVVALMVACAVTASVRINNPALPNRLSLRDSISRLVLASTAVVYIVLVSGVLVAGKEPLVGCLGWPIYSPSIYRSASPVVVYTIRLILSVVGVGLIVGVLVQSRNIRDERPDAYRFARWMGVAVLVETLVQVLLVIFGYPVILWVVYTVIAATLWGLLVALFVRSGLDGRLI
ncbi:MAG: hypothetical protein A2136_09385 [Chloroflexi bacterium RBG_16_54_11]|nr:MAG: hypothetical protein A2136_09385 [Chloroflexi bacterium RBG_16_54_11]